MNIKQSSRVMVVEDDFLVGEMIQGLLADIGLMAVGIAMNGREAVEMACLLRPDVILMDLAMPTMDGFIATQQIMEHCPTPVVALTANDSTAWVDRARTSGIGAYLLKPPTTKELESAILIAMARFGDMMELRRVTAQYHACLARQAKILAEVDLLRDLLPICPVCERKREEPAYQEQVRRYLKSHGELAATFCGCAHCTDSTGDATDH